jgi:hypothetical protein
MNVVELLGKILALDRPRGVSIFSKVSWRPEGGQHQVERWTIRPAAWGFSLVCHAVLLVLVGLSLQGPVPKGTSREHAAVVGITLQPEAPTNRSAEVQESHGDGVREESRPPQDAETLPRLGDLLGYHSDAPLARVLPEADLGVGETQLGQGTAFQAGPAGGNLKLLGEPGGKARVRLFGVVGEGYKFVYVFDRSDSMNWFEQRPLRAAKAELVASLQGLGETHQFQIIFYNHEPLVFNPAGHPYRLAFGTEENKRRAQRFVESVIASGGTRHMEALLLALSMRPDVVFFLTDADDPQLSDAEIHTIVRRAGATTIHTIEFGYGSQSRPDNFLVRIARLTGGQHVYVDVSSL